MVDVVGGAARCVVVCALALGAFIPFASARETDSERVLYNFCALGGCSDGSGPAAGVVADTSGNRYGTTSQGGNFACGGGCGVVYKLAPGGTETVLHAFDGSDGQYADTPLIIDASGNLYGATATGGGKGSCNLGCGVAFKIAPDGTETVLHAFSGGKDGGFPNALIADKKGNLYGTTAIGGAHGDGTVFELRSNGKELVLYSFAGGNDGAGPAAGVIRDKLGNLYGTTAGGGLYNSGTVFKLAPDGTETVLYAFTGGSDGGPPYASLVADRAGNLYGTTYFGGANGGGNVFKVAPDGSETSLYAFCTQGNCSDGNEPLAALVVDKSGNLYGTTSTGGQYGNGVVFKLAPDGIETVLHSFNAGVGDGAWPISGLIAVNGILYGTAQGGGTNSSGVVFRVRE